MAGYQKRFQQGVVPAKLNRPAVRGNTIPRPHLIARLNAGVDKPLTLISAPAGFGKTTLAAQWLEQSSRRSAWLSLDPKDDDPEQFLRYMIAALDTVFPGICTDSESLLSTATLPPPGYLADKMLSELSEIDGPIVLVLDDFHNISSEAIQTIIIRMLQHLPDRLHMAVLTRADPPWPHALWRVRRWLNELRAADLRFSQEEARSFFAQGFERTLSADTVEMLQKRIEGWAAGLQMALLSLADAEHPEQQAKAFSHGDRLVVDFLMDEVLSRQPPEILSFLSVSAMFDRFCAALTDFVMRDQNPHLDSRQIISRLEAENLFLVPLDSERHDYRYYHFFQHLVVQHLTAVLSPERKDLLHRQAAEWFIGQGRIEEAMHHFLAAGAVDDAVRVFLENMHRAIDQDLSRRILGRWLALFPASALEQHPALLVARSYQKMFHWDLLGMAKLLDQCEALLQQSGCSVSEADRRRFRQDLDVHRCFLLYWKGDAEAALRHALLAQVTVPREHRYAHTTAIVYAAGSYSATGRREEALRLLTAASADDCAVGSLAAGQLLTARCAIEHYSGNLHAVEQCARKMFAVHETVPMPDYWRGYASYFLGAVAYERNFLDAAAEQFGHVERMRYRVMTRMYNDSLLGLALIAQAKGQPDRARQYLSVARSLAVEMSDPQSMRMTDWIEVRLAIASGASSCPPEAGSMTPDSMTFWLEAPALIRSEHLVRSGDPKDPAAVLRSIEDDLKGAKQHHNTRQVIQFTALKAVALKRAGEPTLALEVLEETLALAEPLGFVRTFVDRGPLMAELLREVLQKRPQRRYVRMILDAFEGHNSSGPRTILQPETCGSNSIEAEIAAAAPPCRLTHREMDVLNMLGERRSGKEIAERLGISPETVKTHTRNIYRKLKVNGRRQVVVAASRLGVFPERPIR